jgi:hypothetical protein
MRLLSILSGIMFPNVRTLTLGCTMSPELVDQTILACCKPHFLKVARVIIDVAKALAVPQPESERLLTDEELEERMRMEEDFIAGRIKALVETGGLEGAGNLDRSRHSEVRLTGKDTNRA